MNIIWQRYLANNEATLSRVSLDGHEPAWVGLEDQKQDGEKVMHETRIPAGVYDIKLRNEGGMTKKYTERYEFHIGMLHLQDVPNFEFIYIHTGNTDDHTSGCLLVGYVADEDNFTIGQSRKAYEDLYREVMAEAWAETLTIEIKDEIDD